MWLNNLSKHWLARRVAGAESSKPRRQSVRFVPRLEVLEDRMVPSYVFQTIDDPNAGTTGNGVQGTFAIGINAGGLISGNYGDANNVTHGFLLANGQYTTFDDPAAGTASGQGTNAFSLNDQGQVVGFYWDTTPNPVFGGFDEHGFLLSHGQYTTIDEPNAVGTTQATAINDAGVIVGQYLDARSVFHGFQLSGGQYTTLDDPNAGTTGNAVQGTVPTGINAAGEITGFYVGPNNDFHGFLLNQGQYTTIDEPNAAPGPFLGTEAIGINALGQIVGNYETADLVLHGFLLAHGQYTTLDDPNAGTGNFQGTFPNGINGSGKIVGYYVDANSLDHGFLATPVSDSLASASGLTSATGILRSQAIASLGLTESGGPLSSQWTIPVESASPVGVVNAWQKNFSPPALPLHSVHTRLDGFMPDFTGDLVSEVIAENLAMTLVR